MGPQWNRRDVLKGLAAASAAIVLPRDLEGRQQEEPIAEPQVEIQITPVSPHTFRLSILALDKNGVVQALLPTVPWSNLGVLQLLISAASLNAP
jgi:hypothetical protein